MIAAKLLPGLAQADQVYARRGSTYVPPGLAGLVLAGLLAAILGPVAAGLSASASMVADDFGRRFAPKRSETARVRMGRGIRVVVLVLCAVLAPGIKQFKGVYGYRVQIWSRLAPPVFVCGVAGSFTRRATPRGAVATLTVGALLGAGTFWALGQPEIVTQLPRYLRSALNGGFVITLVCAATMALGSRSGGANPGANEVADLTAAAAATSMTAGERGRYRLTLAVLAVVWLTVVGTFSPWGRGTGR